MIQKDLMLTLPYHSGWVKNMNTMLCTVGSDAHVLVQSSLIRGSLRRWQRSLGGLSCRHGVDRTRGGTLVRDNGGRCENFNALECTKKDAWVRVGRKDDVTAMLEGGMFVNDRFWLVVDESAVEKGVMNAWSALGSLGPVVVIGKDNMLRFWENGCIIEEVIGEYRVVSTAEDVKDVEAMQGASNGVFYVVLDARDWKIIPVENLIAAFQGNENMKLIMTVGSVDDAKLMCDVMEHGTDGVMLHTGELENGCGGLHAFRDYILEELDGRRDSRRQYSIGTVTRVDNLGLGDRICVDLAENMVPGQGFLLSSFARGFFLVHSECEETSYINSRPFRVNAGPVHSYIEFGEKTGYLSELKSGSQVSIFDEHGNSKAAIVGRVKMEKRPLILIEAKGQDSGETYSIMLQNAETVKLIGPHPEDGFRTISVSMIKQGDEIYLFEYLDSGARHAGMLINESIREY